MLPGSWAAFGRPMFVRAALAGLLAAGALGGTADAVAVRSAKTVTLKNIAFNREVTTIKAGQRVTWKWQDGPYVEHNIHSVGKPRFAGSSAKSAGTYTVRFTRKGTYRYTCTLHPGMNGRILVK